MDENVNAAESSFWDLNETDVPDGVILVSKLDRFEREYKNYCSDLKIDKNTHALIPVDEQSIGLSIDDCSVVREMYLHSDGDDYYHIKSLRVVYEKIITEVGEYRLPVLDGTYPSAGTTITAYDSATLNVQNRIELVDPTQIYVRTNNYSAMIGKYWNYGQYPYKIIDGRTEYTPNATLIFYDNTGLGTVRHVDDVVYIQDTQTSPIVSIVLTEELLNSGYANLNSIFCGKWYYSQSSTSFLIDYLSLQNSYKLYAVGRLLQVTNLLKCVAQCSFVSARQFPKENKIALTLYEPQVAGSTAFLTLLSETTTGARVDIIYGTYAVATDTGEIKLSYGNHERWSYEYDWGILNGKYIQHNGDIYFINTNPSKNYSSGTYSVTAQGHLVTAHSDNLEWVDTADQIYSISGHDLTPAFTDEISYDTFRAEVDYDYAPQQAYTPLMENGEDYYDGIETSDGLIFCGYYSPNILNAPYGSAIRYWHNGKLRSVFRLKNVERIGATKFAINAISQIGLLDKKTHVGGIYEYINVKGVINDILGANHGYTFGKELDTITMRGWLPYGTQRENLQQVMLAANLTLRKITVGNNFDHFEFDVPLTYPYRNIDDNAVYQDGGHEVEYPDDYERAVVTEHIYVMDRNAEQVTIYDNSDDRQGALGEYVHWNNAPIIVGTIQYPGTMTLTDISVNGAYATGKGNITGVPYTHFTGKVARGASDINAKTVSIDQCTMISDVNSSEVASRLLAYYSQTKRIRVNINQNAEYCGGRYTIHDDFDDEYSGFMEECTYNVSSNMKSEIVIATGYSN